MSSSNVARVAIIGCGRVSGHHCRSVVETDGAELVAVCDLVLDKANLYCQQFGTRAYTNYHHMLIENPQINTVATAVGAFALPNASSADSAVLLTLMPGSYSAQVSSVSGGSGTALVEVYEVPE